MSFELTTENVGSWLVGRGLAESADVVAEELTGGVSAAVLAVRAPGVALVVKQALPRLRVADEWLATPERAETEARAMRLCGSLTPGVVPTVLDVAPAEHVLVMELVEEGANWQAEVAAGAPHERHGRWAGEVLGRWHERTAHDRDVGERFGAHEAFEQLRLRPFHETVIERLPDAAARIEPYLAELRGAPVCLVHGDYAMKNMLVGPARKTVLDFEVAHAGSPVFDLGFFLSYAVLSAVRWPRVGLAMRELADGLLAGYRAEAGAALADDVAGVTGHTACLVLARTDGKSPALFLDERSRSKAREVGLQLLSRPEGGLWSWA